MKMTSFFALAALSTFALSASAADPAAKLGGVTKFGTAGCGLGSIILGDKKGIMQIFAATTNSTFASQTFGITSGTSNCDDGGTNLQTAKGFVEANREALAKDIARGNGESLAALATIGGCSNTRTVGAALQKNYSSIFTSADTSNAAVSDRVVSSMKSDASLSCARL